MKGKTFLTALILLQLITFSGFAQNTELRFNLVEGIGGKPLGKITSITQDPHGYMWFSGQDEHCLYRYDGVRMITFRHDDANPNSLGGNFVNSVYADASGIIWIGLNEGLDRFEPATGEFKHFRHDPNDPSSISGNVTLVLRDRKGNLWVGTDEGLDRLDEKTGKFIHYRNEPGNPRSLSSNKVINIYEDRQGVIWIGTNFPWMGKPSDEGGLNRLDPDGSFTRYMHDPKNPHSLISNKVRAIFEDSRGIFWVGTAGDGLHTMDRKSGRFERHSFDPSKPDKLSRPPLRTEPWHKANDQVSFIMEDCVGSIWIGTMFSGINRYDTVTKKIIHFEGSNGFPDSSGWNAYQSRDGVIWISTQENNLFRADPFHKTINSVPTISTPLSFVEDKEENLWVGTEESGLLQYDKHGKLLNQFKHDPSDSNSLFDSANDVLSLFHDMGDTIWIGTHAGPGIFNKVTQQFSKLIIELKYNAELVARNVPRIIQDRRGSIWFVLNGNGLLRYTPRDGSFNQYLHDAKDTTSLTSDHIVSVFEDRSGEIWAGDYTGGINRLIPETGRFLRYNKGVPFHRLLQDSEGSIWAGTNNGLYLYNPNEDKFSGFFDPETEASTFRI
ncbi:MAG: ligand-binding sensor domain-containing protein, partial [Chitinophagaceae bacterium]